MAKSYEINVVPTGSMNAHLLRTLEQGNKVAILETKEGMELILDALIIHRTRNLREKQRQKLDDLIRGCTQIYDLVWGEGT